MKTHEVTSENKDTAYVATQILFLQRKTNGT